MGERERKAVKLAFSRTMPMLMGFSFLGAAYGVMMTGMGFAPWLPVLMAITICAGSMEFVTAALLLAPFNPLGAALMTLMVNGRHLFYGLSLIEPYQNCGKAAIYMKFALVDETYALLVSEPVGKHINQKAYMFCVTLFNQSYWVLGSALGAFFASFIQFDVQGIDYVMTALFVVLFMSLWRMEKGLSKGRRAAIIGLVVPLLARVVFGAERFMIPAMAFLLLALLLARPWIEKGGRIYESQ